MDFPSLRVIETKKYDGPGGPLSKLGSETAIFLGPPFVCVDGTVSKLSRQIRGPSDSGAEPYLLFMQDGAVGALSALMTNARCELRDKPA